MLIIGHSFVGRLAHAVGSRPELPDNFNLKPHTIDFLYKSGGKITNIRNLMPLIVHYKPDIVYLQIGGNDIRAVNHDDALRIAAAIMSLAEDILELSSCKRVYIGQLFCRFAGKYLSTRQAELYNEHVHVINDHLKKSRADERITWWICKGTSRPTRAIRHSDGVHLDNNIGMVKYYRAIRGALLHGLRRLVN